MSSAAELYQAILDRKSVRRYQDTPLDAATLARVNDIISEAKALVPNNQFQVLAKGVSQGEDLVSALGAYGRIVSPPHYLVPYLTGEKHLLLDLGYRTEQIAVRLTAMGIGSCYVGALRREQAIKVQFGLPDRARTAAFLIFGYPAASLGGRAVNAVMRLASGATNKLPADRVFFHETFDRPGSPPPELAPLINAARTAPSAIDAQPWRFLWHGGHLHLFVRTSNPKYGGGVGAEYRFHDAGACMGNVELALEAQGMEGRWVPYEGAETGIPSHPEGLQPIAVLR